MLAGERLLCPAGVGRRPLEDELAAVGPRSITQSARATRRGRRRHPDPAQRRRRRTRRMGAFMDPVPTTCIAEVLRVPTDEVDRLLGVFPRVLDGRQPDRGVPAPRLHLLAAVVDDDGLAGRKNVRLPELRLTQRGLARRGISSTTSCDCLAHGVSAAGTVAYAAHIVGFLAGMLIAWPLRPGTPPPPEPRGLLFGRRARPRHTW
jgi:hypothetical protein